MSPLTAQASGSAGFKTIATSGREQVTDGLIVHKGVMDVNSWRSTGILYPASGAGMEGVFFSDTRQGKLQCYDRDFQQYLDLYIAGANVVLQPMNGIVSMPAGTVNQLIGQFAGSSSFATPQANIWTETDVRVNNCQCSGKQVRIEISGSVFSTGPVGASGVYIGIGADGSLIWNLLAFTTPGANYTVPFSAQAYYSPTAGLHRFSLFLYGINNTCQLNSVVTHTLYVQEFRA